MFYEFYFLLQEQAINVFRASDQEKKNHSSGLPSNGMTFFLGHVCDKQRR